MLRESNNFDEISEETALLAFISDFLERNGFGDTARSLHREASNLNREILTAPEITNLVARVQNLREAAANQIHRTQSVLFEWWQVFWKILREKNRQREQEQEQEKVKEQEKEFDKKMTEQQSFKMTEMKSRTDLSNYRLDMATLVGIEKCLKQARVLNKDLNRLSNLELKRVEALLKSNKISPNSWLQYLSLCKEYQKSNASKTIDTSVDTFSSKSNAYLGVIDQINQPVDSRELLILRQSLYQEYTKKQQKGQNLNIFEKKGQEQEQEQNQNLNQNLNHVAEEEVNFDEFINEYLL